MANRFEAVAIPGVYPWSSSEEVKDEMISTMTISGSSSLPSVAPQRHVGQKRLVRNGCISPSNVAKGSVRVDKRPEMCSPSGVLHHQHPRHDVFGTANVVNLTDNSPAITGHGNTVNISANIMDTRAATRLRTESWWGFFRTDMAGGALVPLSEYLANGSSCSGVCLSGLNNKGKEINHDMMDSMQIGEANSRRDLLTLSVLIVIAVISSFCFPLLIQRSAALLNRSHVIIVHVYLFDRVLKSFWCFEFW
jgi:hypothetical protein